MIGEWSTLLYDLFVRDVFGSKLLFSAFLMLFMGFFGFKMRMSFDAMGVSLVGLLLLLAGFGFIPMWTIILIVMALGLIIAFAVLKIGKR